MILTTKISQTILEFGEPLLSELPDDHTKEDFEATILIVITSWNAVVMDGWKGGGKFEAALLSSIKPAPKEIQLIIKKLIKRKKKKFANDPRGVGNHWVREESGELIFGCDARLDVDKVPPVGPMQ